MIFPSNRVRIMVATKPVDFRKGHAGLAALVICGGEFQFRRASAGAGTDPPSNLARHIRTDHDELIGII